MKPIVSFRVLDATDLDEWLATRGRTMAKPTRGIGEQARAELEVWRAAQRIELSRHRFTVSEMSCIADILNGTMFDTTLATGAGLVFADAMYVFNVATGESSYGKKWGIDERELTDKLAQLSPVADHALRYAVARWWNDHAAADRDGFRLYGLNVVPDPTPEQDS